MRRQARVDANQKGLVKELRKLGISVEPALARLGLGVPDLLVGYMGRTFLLELKDPEKVPSQRRLTPAEDEWHGNWKGHVAVVETLQEALEAIGLDIG